jgi:ABC-type bacteriocin/lantibiotic exporter with double-glycine peptidase domain
MISILIISLLGAEPANQSTPDLRCGAYCLYVSLKALDVEGVTFGEIESRLGPPSAAGYSIGQLDELARHYGLQTLAVRTNTGNLRLRRQPFACVALLKGGHFVNLAEVDDSTAFVIDPPREYALPSPTLSSVWDGTALLLARDPLEAEEALGSRWRPWWMGAAVLSGVVGIFCVIAIVRRRMA